MRDFVYLQAEEQEKETEDRSKTEKWVTEELVNLFLTEKDHAACQGNRKKKLSTSQGSCETAKNNKKARTHFETTPLQARHRVIARD